LRQKAALRYATQVAPDSKSPMVEQLRTSSLRAMALFAGEEVAQTANAGKGANPAGGGLAAVSQFIEANVPAAERERVSEVLLRIVNGSLFELNQLARERDGLKPLPPGEDTAAFMTQAVVSLTDSFFYPAPVLLQLQDFQQVQASVFQVTRAPGKTLVYLGAVALILGVFAMLYIRERRLWIWLADAPDGHGTAVRMALSTTRRTMDVDQEFIRLRDDLLGPVRPEESAPPTAATSP
jgi:cytochrome c biogenesis protein